MDSNRKLVTVRFLLDALKISSGAHSCDIWLSDYLSERDMLWRCAVEILKSEPSPPYQPPSGRMVQEYILGEMPDTPETKVAREMFPFVADVLWSLSLKGILRPGLRHAVRQSFGQSTADGHGYSLTSKGKEWLNTFTPSNLEELVDGV